MSEKIFSRAKDLVSYYAQVAAPQDEVVQTIGGEVSV